MTSASDEAGNVARRKRPGALIMAKEIHPVLR